MSILENAASIRFNGGQVKSMYIDGKKIFGVAESSLSLPSTVLNVEDFRVKNETEEYSDTETLRRAAESFSSFCTGVFFLPVRRSHCSFRGRRTSRTAWAARP